MLITIALALAAAQPNATGEKITLTLDEAVELGTEKSFRFQRSVRSGKMADERLRGTKAGLGPRLDVGYGADQSQRYYRFDGSYDYNQGRPPSTPTPRRTRPTTSTFPASRSARFGRLPLSRDSSRIDVDQARLDVSTDIRTNYVQALRAQEQVNADSEYLALIDSLLTRARTSQPASSRSFETERSNAQQSLESTRTNADLTFSNLRQVLQLNDNEALELTTELQPPQALPSTDRLSGSPMTIATI
jgi:outer membrane protein TolC